MAVEEGRSLAETPTWSVATVTTFMVAVCFVVERSIHRFGKWLQRTKKKALFASLEKIREELMLLGIVSLMLGQTARWVSEICVPSSLFTSRFYICSEDDYGSADDDEGLANDTISENARRLFNILPHNCGEGYEPFVSYQGLEQLNRFLFLLGITHVSYSCATAVLAMIKVYGWRKWENRTPQQPSGDLQARKNATMRRQSTFVFHHTSHPWSKNKILIWMLCFMRQFKGSIAKSDYLTIRLGFITHVIAFDLFHHYFVGGRSRIRNMHYCSSFLLLASLFTGLITVWARSAVLDSKWNSENHKLPPSYDFHKYIVRSMEDEFHGIVGISWPLWGYAIFCIFINIHGLNMYFWLSFIPAIITMLVGTKLQHVVAQLALEIVETTDPLVGTQLNPRDSLFWFRKPKILLWLIHFISFQNAFEMASFIWSLWGLNMRSCLLKNHLLIAIRLISGLLVQFWCSYSTLPLNVIVTQMGSKFKKALIAESVRESLHSWCKRVKEKSRRDSLNSHLTRSVCSLDTTTDERDETTTIETITPSESPSTSPRVSVSCDDDAVDSANRLALNGFILDS